MSDEITQPIDDRAGENYPSDPQPLESDALEQYFVTLDEVVVAFKDVGTGLQASRSLFEQLTLLPSE